MKRPAAIFLFLLIAGCSANTALLEGRRLIDQGRVDEGILRLQKGVEANPEDTELRNYHARTRDLYVNQLIYEGEKARMLGHGERALAAFQRALALSAGNARAQAGLDAALAEQDRHAAVAQARAFFEGGSADMALALLKKALAANPGQKDAQALQRQIEESGARSEVPDRRLNAAFRKPVTLELRDALLRGVLEVLTRTSGINFVLDHDVRPDLRVTIFVRDTPIEDAVNFLLVTNQLEKKVLNENTVLIYPNIPSKTRDYQELVVKSFYLANADVKQTLNLIKSVVKTRDVFVDERLNLVIMRDTREAIRIAEKLIAVQDLAEPEVILELEVIEVTRNKIQNLGMQYPTQVSAGVQGATGIPGQITLDEWLNRSSGLVNLRITDPAFVLNLQRQDADTNLLANPRIRVRNREKARIHIGDRLPVITTTSTANVGVSESVQYLDVGLKLDVETNIYLDDQVAMKVVLEVSSIVQQITSKQGTLTYRIGTRNAATVLRVANGETQVLAGLIQDEDRRTADKVPGLGDLPILGRLFTNNNDNRTKTEIVLLITPYVVRNVERPPPSALEVPSGTEGSLGAPALRLSSTEGQPAVSSHRRMEPVPIPAPASAAASAPASASDPAQVPAPVPGVPPPAALQSVLLTAPEQVQAGREFAISVAMPPDIAGNVRLELAYDAARLQPTGIEGTSGRVQLVVSGTTEVRFRALEGQSGPAQISASGISVAGAGGESRILPTPPPVTIVITPR